MNSSDRGAPNERPERASSTRKFRTGLLLAASLTIASCSVSLPPASGATPDDTTGTVQYAPGGTLDAGYVAPSGQWTSDGQTGQWCPTTGTKTTSDALTTATLDLTTTARGVARDWTDRVPGQLRVYRGPALSAQNLDAQHARQLETLGLRTLEADRSGWSLLEGDDATLRDAAEALVADGTVQYAQPEYVYRTAGLPAPPSDTHYRTGQKVGFNLSSAEAAWSATEPGCDPIVVAVIDSGVPEVGGWDDPELQPNFVPRKDWFNVSTDTKGNAEPPVPTWHDDYWHGTAVASVLAMVTHNGNNGGGASIAYNQVKVLPIGAMIAGGGFSTGSVAEAIDYALGVHPVSNPYPAQILNFSLGSAAEVGDDEFLRLHFNKIAVAGSISVVATGNESKSITTPQSQNMWTIGVGATDKFGSRASFSNYGPGLDFMAIGTQVYARSEGKTTAWTGTSFATPMMAGQVALWMYANQHHSGSATNGLSGTNVFNAAMKCLSAASANVGREDGWDPVTHAWRSGSGWQSATGAGLVDTSKLVSANFSACR